LEKLFSSAKLADLPNDFIKTGRLQRKLNKIYGDRWAALHHTAGFVDPLHSTGIAHSLAGVEKLLSILIETDTNLQNRNSQLHSYQSAFVDELALIDLLVAGCYKSRHHFDLFTAFTMLYFVCTIQYEQSRLSGQAPGLFLSADNQELSSIVRNCYNELSMLLNKNRSPSENDINSYVRLVSEKIQPFNSVGLMDPSKNNMYEHTAALI
jgi:FADH2 O2-dependent halogenase